MESRKTKKYYGIVEGFFSYPLSIWDTNERLNTLKFINQYASNINTYLYCPKNDVYVVEKWNKLYPSNKIQGLKKVINYCRANNIKFIFGINPSLVIFKNEESRKKWINNLTNKIKQLLSIGCLDFCLLFDDIPFAYNVLDGAQNKDGAIIGKTLVSLSNQVLQILKNQIQSLWLCSPDYCFKKETSFTKELRFLNPEIIILWSGKDVFVKTISEADLNRVKTLIGIDKKIVWWSNYPVNDCEQNVGMFNLGGFNPPKGNLNIKGILTNPMRECYANLPFYITFQEYLKSPKSYKRGTTYNYALRKILGKDYRRYKFIISEFSSPNLVDNFDKYFYKYMKKIIRQKQLVRLFIEMQKNYKGARKYKPVNFYTRKFIKTIEKLMFQYKIFLIILRKLIEIKKVNNKEFSKLDIFPTTTNIPRYFPEIFKIVKIRVIRTTENQLNNKEKVIISRIEKIYFQFLNNYKGELKLAINETETSVYIQAIKDAVELDKRVVLRKINSDISVTEKIRILSERLNINRFHKKVINFN